MRKSNEKCEKVYVTTGFPQDMMDKIDALAKGQRASRAFVVRQLIDFGLGMSEGAKRK